ncbi:MAG TPA: hypothetical protein VGB55_16180, partial [Tepidisphaeraceae bacterium]|jgi:hypothetical protein
VGITGLSLRTGAGVASSSFRLLLPLTACVCLIGFTGALRWEHAAAVAVIAGVLVWSMPPSVARLDHDGTGRLKPVWLIGAAILMLGALAVCLLAVQTMPTLLSLAVGKPVIVLIFVFAIIGLLASESQLDRPAAAIDTVVGYVLACLGFALPLVIVLGKGISYAVVSASTQPATAPTVVMPLHTWRIDSVLLVVLSILVLPAGLGRYTVGRVEGILFVLAALTYLVMTVLAGIGI